MPCPTMPKFWTAFEDVTAITSKSMMYCNTFDIRSALINLTHKPKLRSSGLTIPDTG